MKLLICGGSGFLGQAILHDPLFSQDEFTILSRKHTPESAHPRIQVQFWNPYELDGWQSVLEGQDVILHLAGENIGAGLWTKKRKQSILTSRVLSGKTMQQAIIALNKPPALFIQASAVGFYGSRGEEMLDEETPRGNGFLSDVCAEWEQSTDGLQAAGIRRIVIRTGVVLAAHAGIYPRMLLPIKLCAGGNLGSGKQYLPWLHVADYPSIIRFLIDQADAAGVYNLCAPQAVQFSEFGKALSECYQRPYWLPVPAFALRLVLGEMSALILDSQRVVPKRLMQAGYLFRYADLKSALKTFV
jgi:uncharacterized protein